MSLREFGKKIREYRIAKNLTQEELAGRAGVAVSQVGRIERGEINPGLSMVLTLAKAMDVKPHQLFDLDGELVSSEDLNNILDALTSIFSNEEIKLANESQHKTVQETIRFIEKVSMSLKQNTVPKELLGKALELTDWGFWELNKKQRMIHLCSNLQKYFPFEKSKYSFEEFEVYLPPGEINRINDISSQLDGHPQLMDINHAIIDPKDGQQYKALSNISRDNLTHEKIVGVTRIDFYQNGNGHHKNENGKSITEIRIILQDILNKLSSEAFLPIEKVRQILATIEKNNDFTPAQIADIFENLLDHCDILEKEINNMKEQINGLL